MTPQRLTGTPPDRARVFSIRWIVTILAVVLTAAAVLSVGIVSERNARRALASELTSRLILETRNLALTSAGVLLSDYPELTLHPLIREKLARQPELAFAVVVDRSGIVQGDSDPHRLGLPYVPPPNLRPAAEPVLPGAGERLERTDHELIATVPITHASGTLLGKVVVGMRASYLDGVIQNARRQQSLLLIGFLLTGVVVSFVVVSQVLKPVAALRAGIERIAGGDLDTPIDVRDRTELGLLADAVNDMASGLKRAQTEMVERERLAREMELAREIQRSILPSEPLTVGEFFIEGSQRAAAEVGGDYYDYFLLPDGRVGLAIADVSGKGLAGCLVMAMLSALLRADRAAAASPVDLLAALDDRLSATLRIGSFVTIFYGVLDPRTGRLTYASAGHNPTLHYRRATKSVELLRTRGIPVAAIRGGAIRSTLENLEVTLEPGDTLLQFTDGVSEAFAPDGREQFGTERLEMALRETADGGTRAVLDGLFERLTGWIGTGPRLDDETLLVVHRDPSFVPTRVAVDVEGPVERYEDARRRGVLLVVDVGVDPLTPIRDWLERSTPLRALPATRKELLTTALYEICANVAEHGYRNRTGRSFEVWWSPDESGEGAGSFLVRDQGTPFEANGWRGQDLGDPRVRKRGRGLGLEIIHRAMRPVIYYPATPVGNVTWMRFGNAGAVDQEVRHAG